MKIHFIEKENIIRRLDKLSNVWESGNWKISCVTADLLIGGDIYFHKAQDKPSYFGGKVTGYRVIDSGESKGRLVFEFEASMEHKGVKTSKDGWGMEKKIVE